MKKNILCILLFVSSFNLFSSPRMLPCFPDKYERWINHYHSKSESYQIDFCNYEMSTLPHYSEEDGYESWFIQPVSKSLKKNRKKLNENVALCFYFFWDKGYLVSELSAAVKSLTLVYDDCEINLYDKLQKWDYHDRENYSSIYGLALLENSLFQKITSAKELYIMCKTGNEIRKYNLQIPGESDSPFIDYDAILTPARKDLGYRSYKVYYKQIIFQGEEYYTDYFYVGEKDSIRYVILHCYITTIDDKTYCIVEDETGNMMQKIELESKSNCTILGLTIRIDNPEKPILCSWDSETNTIIKEFILLQD